MKKLYFIILIAITFSCSNNRVTIVVSNEADRIEEFAASELSNYLSKIYPEYAFVVSNKSNNERTIYLGTEEHMSYFDIGDVGITENKEGYVIKQIGEITGLITSSGSQGVLRGVYSLVEKLGYAFVFSGDISPNTREVFDFKEWDFSDEPLVSERTVFNWHNFLSGCSGWDLEDWNKWIDQSQKIGYNTIMVHAYANNPLYTFQFKGMEKPVGYLTSSMNGRDWSTEHLNDVRRLPGGHLFDEPVFGSEAAKVPEEERIEKAQGLMKEVFQHAEERGMDVNIALDFDIVAGIPQNMVKSLPQEDRFLVQHKGIGWMGEKAGPVWIPRPDKPEGYNYYKTQVKTILDLYPQIDIFTLWRRYSGSVWVTLSLEQLPKEWQDEYLKYVRRKPGVAKIDQSVGAFAQSKLVKAYRKAFDELGREDIRISFGTWRWPMLKSMNEFFPEDVSVYILDSEIIRGEQHLHNKQMIDEIAGWIKSRKVIPVIWPHHDDGAYIGSSLESFDNFNSTLTKLKADGFGVIHWMTRPFDSFFIHHIKQTQRSTENQKLEETFNFLSEKWFGKQNVPIMSKYLFLWEKDMPTFGRETSPTFIDKAHYHKFKDADSVIELCQERIQLLQQVDCAGFNEDQIQLYKYFLNYEIFVKDFYCEQDKYLMALAFLDSGKVAQAEKIMQEFQPEAVLRQYAKAIEFGTATKGEKGLLFSMGARWLPHFYSLKQIAGQEKVRINFAHTSHEVMAQMPGFRTYHIDKNQKYWIVYGEKETRFPVVKTNNADSQYPEIFDKGISLDSLVSINLKPYTLNQKFIPGKYRLKLFLASRSSDCELEITVNKKEKERFVTSNSQIKQIDFELEQADYPTLELKSVDGTNILCGISLQKI